MAISAKLSREFYDRFGTPMVDELVGLLNEMEAAFRVSLRESNDETFRRFEAKLEQRLAELAGELRTEMATLGAELRTEMGTLAAELRTEMGTLAAALRTEMGVSASGLRTEMAGLRADMAGLKAELIKWMFLFWLGTVATMLGIGQLLVT